MDADDAQRETPGERPIRGRKHCRGPATQAAARGLAGYRDRGKPQLYLGDAFPRAAHEGGTSGRASWQWQPRRLVVRDVRIDGAAGGAAVWRLDRRIRRHRIPGAPTAL